MSVLTCKCYLWEPECKIVISDVDGTITRSDVMGQVMPLLGAGDWSQEGVVDLYNKIQNNGYKMVYLSSRPIGQRYVFLNTIC